MADFVVLANVDSESKAMVLISALRAHGFDALDIPEGGLPGINATYNTDGYPIVVLSAQAEDAKILFDDLMNNMSA